MAVKTQAQLLAQVASLLADNTTGDISALDVRTCLNDIIDSASYGGKKVYKALLTQTGTNAPVATVLENTLSGTPVLSYSSVGGYRLTLNNEFPQDKTTMIISQNLGGGNPIEVLWATINYLDISTTVNDVLTYTTILIEVYP